MTNTSNSNTDSKARKPIKGVVLILLMLLAVVVGWLAFKSYKYWPTTHQANINAQLNSSVSSPTANTPINKIKVYKSKRYLELMTNGQVVQRYPIRLGFEPVGAKSREGDGKTPEGTYSLDWRNPNSQFYKSLHVSYPNAQDVAQAAKQGLSAGSNIMIHGSFSLRSGLPNSDKAFYRYMPHQDWTLGCIAVTNAAMDDIWRRTKDGTVIEIVP